MTQDDTYKKLIKLDIETLLDKMFDEKWDEGDGLANLAQYGWDIKEFHIAWDKSEGIEREPGYYDEGGEGYTLVTD